MTSQSFLHSPQKDIFPVWKKYVLKFNVMIHCYVEGENNDRPSRRAEITIQQPCIPASKTLWLTIMHCGFVTCNESMELLTISRAPKSRLTTKYTCCITLLALLMSIRYWRCAASKLASIWMHLLPLELREWLSASIWDLKAAFQSASYFVF